MNKLVGITNLDVNTISNGYIIRDGKKVDLEDNKVYLVAMDSSSDSGYYFIKNRKLYNFKGCCTEFYENLSKVLEEDGNYFPMHDLVDLYCSGEFKGTTYEKDAICATFNTSNIEDITLYN